MSKLPHFGTEDADWLKFTLAAARSKAKHEYWRATMWRLRRPTTGEIEQAEIDTSALPKGREVYVAVHCPNDCLSTSGDYRQLVFFTSDEGAAFDFEKADAAASEIFRRAMQEGGKFIEMRRDFPNKIR